ncbi:MAG: lasso peptide biosynthesis protein [Deltaproteobacteria bacterium]|nr:lasso peptide biosynthesis protein [Deltaproteobacteria bacterium]
MPSALLRFFLVLGCIVPLAVPGCAPITEGALEPLAPGQLDAHVALASPGADEDPLEHARALARAQMKAGRPDRAARAARLYLRRAEAAWWMARLEGDSEAIDDRRRTLDRVAREALRWGRRTDDPTLVAMAVLAHPHPRRHRRALRAAVVRLDASPTGAPMETLVALVGDDPAARRQIASWVSHDDDRLQALGLADVIIDGADARSAADALDMALTKASAIADVLPAVAAVEASDPWHVGAQLLRLAHEEIAAGVLREDSLLPRDLRQGWIWRRSVLARLHLRSEASPRSVAMRLALAEWMIESDMVGDAHGVLTALDPGQGRDAVALHGQLVAITAALRGDVAAFEQWYAANAVDSCSVDDMLIDRGEQPDSVLHASAVQALGRQAERGFVRGVERHWEVLMDDTLSKRQRAPSVDALNRYDDEALAWRAICRDHGRDAGTCRRAWFQDDSGAPYYLGMLMMAGRTRHFHPSFLSAANVLTADQLTALAPTLAHYEGAALSTTPEFHRVALRVQLATGDLAGARARLEGHGALLDARLRAWAWLVLDELEAERLTYDQALEVWVPSYESDSPLAVDAEPMPAEDPNLDTDGVAAGYLRGMQLGHRGRHAEALEELLPVLDGVPDAAVVDGLAQAALAAHLSGDAATRDALRLRLFNVDPHSATYALLQARISRDAGQHRVARRFLADALRWQPDDHELYGALVVGIDEQRDASGLDAVAYVRAGSPRGEYLHRDIRRGIDDGTLTTVAVIGQVAVASNGSDEDAWRLAKSLAAPTPTLVLKAIRWVDHEIEHAADPAEARRWAEAGLDLIDDATDPSVPLQTKQLWNMLLAGRAEAGLALARTFDAGEGRTPYSEGEAVVQLLMARREGEVDDALAWDLWRWAYNDDEDVDARIAALLFDPPRGSRLQVLACGELTTLDDLAPALPVCERAWQDGPDDLLTGVSWGFLSFNLPEAEAEAEAEDADPDPEGSPPKSEDTPDDRALAMGTAVFSGPHKAPSFSDDPRLAAGENLAQPWHQNHGVWLGSRGDHAAAADAWWQAYAFGQPRGAGNTHRYQQLRWRGALVRSLSPLTDGDEGPGRDRDVRRAVMALMGAEPVIARGYAELALTRVVEEPGVLARSDLMLPDRVRHLADWAQADLEADRLPPEAMREVVDVLFTPEFPAAQALHQRYAESSLTQLALAESLMDIDDMAAARPLADALLERHPHDPLAVSTALPLLVSATQLDDARALYQASADRYPHDAVLLYANAPESVTGPRGSVPSWVRDTGAFDARVEAITAARMQALMPRRHASEERAAELFAPSTWDAIGERPLRFSDGHGSRILVITNPRASRCQGADCARDLLAGLAGGGRTRQWIRQTRLAGAEATQALFTNAEEVLVAWVLPSGGRVFTVAMAAPVDRFAALLPVLALVRDGFRPLDGVLAPLAATSLRTAGPALRDRWRWRGRHEQVHAVDPEACPVPQTLAALDHDHQRAELLVDVWLASADPAARRALLECATPRDAAARRLALVALLDEDPRIHAFGRRAVQTHPTQTRSDVRTILSTPLRPPVSAPDYLMREDLPSRGLVEVLGALPLSHARPLALRLLTGADAGDRMLAWAAVRLRPELATDAAIDSALDDAPTLAGAAFLLSERGKPADAQRLRDRLDVQPAVGDRKSQRALGNLATALATFLDPQDIPRLGRAHLQVRDGDDPGRAERTRELLREIARDHSRGHELLTDSSQTPGEDDDRAQRWGEALRRRALPIRPESDLRDRSLAELLPGRDYTFARLDAPGLFSSTVADVAERITTGDEAVDHRLSEITGRLLREGGFAALSHSGGLDTTRPIECAKPAGNAGWLCTASVVDREALLEVLAQRDYGDDAGISLPLTFATTAGVVPMALSLLPAILHFVVYPDEDEDDEDGKGNEDGGDKSAGEDSPDVVVAKERARHRLDIGTMNPFRYTIVEARTARVGVDSERYLFVGDRLWVFSTTPAMDSVMRAHEGPALADDPEFQRLTQAWQGGAALQAVSLGRAWPLAEGGAAMEVVLDEGGLRFRYAGAFESEAGVGDIGPALAQLPPGALTTFAHGLGPMPSIFDTAPTAKGPDANRVPPVVELSRARGVAFGWYLGEDERLWRRWLAVAPLDADLRKALRKAKTPPGRRGKSRRHGDLCYLERAGFVLVGECGLVDQVAAGPPPPPPSRDQLRVAHGTFDGPLVAERVPGLQGLPIDQAAILRMSAPVLGIVSNLRVEADWIPADHVAVLEGEVGLRLRPPGDRTRVIDDWLAATEGENAATLPRRLRSEELEAPLRYVVDVPDAEAFVRNTLADSPRIQAKAISPTRVELVVSPVPATPRPVALSSGERKRLTDSTEAIRSDDPAIMELAASLAPAGTEPTVAAQAISHWVHERITYEVTPRSLDGVEILEAGRGDCTEYARLTVTLLRAAGVPAQTRDGMAASGDELVAHAWVAYHDGTVWHEIDPTWGRTTATAGHLEMSVLDALALISLGKLDVVTIAAP